MEQQLPHPPTVYYDAECRFCIACVKAIRALDNKDTFLYKPLQTVSEEEAQKYGIPLDYSTSVLLENGIVYTKSDSTLHIIKHLRTPFWLLYYAGKCVPKCVRDGGYKIISKVRKVFGKAHFCAECKEGPMHSKLD